MSQKTFRLTVGVVDWSSKNFVTLAYWRSFGYSDRIESNTSRAASRSSPRSWLSLFRIPEFSIYNPERLIFVIFTCQKWIEPVSHRLFCGICPQYFWNHPKCWNQSSFFFVQNDFLKIFRNFMKITCCQSLFLISHCPNLIQSILFFRSRFCAC